MRIFRELTDSESNHLVHLPTTRGFVRMCSDASFVPHSRTLNKNRFPKMIKTCSAKLFRVGLLCTALSCPLLSYANQAHVPLKTDTQTLSDAQREAEIALWIERVEELVLLAEKNEQNLKLTRERLAGLDLNTTAAYLFLLHDRHILTDEDGLLEEYEDRAIRENSKRHRLVAELLRSRTSYPYFEDPNEDLIKAIKEAEQSNDEVLQVLIQKVNTEGRVNDGLDDFAKIREIAAFVPNRGDEDYFLTALIYNQHLENTHYRNLDYHGGYNQTLKSLYLRQEYNLKSNVLVSAKNLLLCLSIKYGGEPFYELSKRLTAIDAGLGEMRQQNIATHLSAFSGLHFKEDFDYASQAFSEPEGLEAPKGFLFRYMLEAAIRLNDTQTVNELINNPESSKYLGGRETSLPALTARLIAEKIEPNEYYTELRSQLRGKLKIIQSLKQQTRQKARLEYELRNGEIKLIGRSPSLNAPIETNAFKELSPANRFHLNSILARLPEIRDIAKAPSTPLLGVANSYTAGYPAQSYHQPNANALELRGENPLSNVYNVLHRNSVMPFSSAYVQGRYAEANAYIHDSDEELTLPPLHQAYRELFKINILLNTGEHTGLWKRLIALKTSNTLRDEHTKHLNYDIDMTEAKLIFAEGDLDLLLSHLDQMLEQARLINRDVDDGTILSMIALSLSENGYNSAAHRAANAIEQTRHMIVPHQITAQIVKLDSNSKIDRSVGSLQAVYNLRNAAGSSEERLLINAALMNHYLNTPSENIEAIRRLQRDIISDYQTVESQKAFLSIRKLLSKTNLILSRSGDIEEDPKHYEQFIKHTADLMEFQNRQRNALKTERHDATWNQLATQTAAISAQNNTNAANTRRAIMMSSLGGLLTIFGIGTFNAARRRNRISLERETELAAKDLQIDERAKQRDSVTDRAIRNSYFNTKRFVDDLQRRLGTLRQNSEGRSIDALIDAMEDDLAGFRQKSARIVSLGRGSLKGRVDAKDTLDVSLYFDQVAADWQRELPNNNVTFRLQYPADLSSTLPAISVDSSFLDMLMGNLIEVSLKHTIYGNIDVQIDYEPKPSILEIVVNDTGNKAQDNDSDYILSQDAVAELNGSLDFTTTPGYSHSVTARIKVDPIFIENTPPLDLSAYTPHKSDDV